MTRPNLTAFSEVLPPGPLEPADLNQGASAPLDSPPADRGSKRPKDRWGLLTLILVVVITPGALIGVALVVMVKRLLHRRAG